MTVIIKETTAIAYCAGFGALADAGSGAGSIKFYAGARPANLETAIAGQTLLITMALQKPSFPVPTIVNHFATADVNAVANVLPTAAGTATFYRVFDSAGNACWDGTVTAPGGGGDAEISNTTVALGETIQLTKFTNRVPTGQ